MREKIILPITGSSLRIMDREVKRLLHHPLHSAVSLLELRFDSLRSPLESELLFYLRKWEEELPGKKLLFTIRSKRQGGSFDGSEDAYFHWNRIACESGAVSYVDLEIEREGYSSGAMSRNDRVRNLAFRQETEELKVRMIGSFHDFRTVPEEGRLLCCLREMEECRADIYKLAVMPESKPELLRFMLTVRKFRDHRERALSHDAGYSKEGRSIPGEAVRPEKEYIVIGMGETGRCSRYLGELSGSDYSFSRITEGSAPGQIELSRLLRIQEAMG